MKALRKYSYEFYAFLLAVGFFTDGLYLVVADSVPMLLSTVLSLLLVADAVALFFTLRKLWRTKWKRHSPPLCKNCLQRLPDGL